MMETVTTLSKIANDLYALQESYKEQLQTLRSNYMPENLRKLGRVYIGDKDVSYYEYRSVENAFVRKYTGDTYDTAEVWAAFKRGECFPAFPYTWLPAGEHYADWWEKMLQSEPDAWIVNEILAQAGWERGETAEDWDVWYAPVQEEEPEQEETEEYAYDDDDIFLGATSIIERLRGAKLNFDNFEDDE